MVTDVYVGVDGMDLVWSTSSSITSCIVGALDSIAVSLFTNSIRQQGPNNYSDTVRRGALSTFNRVETLKEAFSEGVRTGLAMKTYQFPSFYIYFFPIGRLHQYVALASSQSE